MVNLRSDGKNEKNFKDDENLEKNIINYQNDGKKVKKY